MKNKPEEPFEEILSVCSDLPIEDIHTLLETAKGLLAKKEYLEDQHSDKK